MSVRRIPLQLVQMPPGHLETVAFLGIVLGVGWPLALTAGFAPTASLFAWIPAAAAVFLARAKGRRMLHHLGIDRLGWPDAYLLALWIPVLFVVGQIAFTVILGAGRLDEDWGGLHPASGGPPTTEAIEQLVAALTVAPILTAVLALGSEIGWRAFLLPRLLPYGTWPAITITSLSWWLWQMPLATHLGDPRWPIQVVSFFFWCLLVGEILGWLYLRTRSVWAPALMSAAMATTSYLPALLLRDLSPDAAAIGPASLIVPALVVVLIRQRSTGEVVPGR